MTPPRKLHIKSYGCQMNVYDAQRMADALAAMALPRPRRSMTPTWSSSTPATSATRRPRRSFPSWAGCALPRRAPRASGSRMMLAVAGLRGAGRGRRDPRAARRRRHRGRPADLPPPAARLLAAAAARRGPVIETEFPAEDKFDVPAAAMPRGDRARGITAFLTVQEGCDKFCTLLRRALHARRRACRGRSQP